MSKICFIAIYGAYEQTCKKFVKQSIDTDFICFTDNSNIISNGWIIDTTPYHLINKSKMDNGTIQILYVTINILLISQSTISNHFLIYPY